MNNNNQSGFTLIELLVVITIIGILASATLAQLAYSRALSRDSVRISEIREIEKALALYQLRNNSYPVISASRFNQPDDVRFAIVQTANAQPISGSDGTQTAIETALHPAFLSSLPTAPGRPYFYEGDGTRYCLAVELEVTPTPVTSNSFCINVGANMGIAPSLLNNSARVFAAGNVTSSLGC